MCLLCGLLARYASEKVALQDGAAVAHEGEVELPHQGGGVAGWHGAAVKPCRRSHPESQMSPSQ
ncbi:hypothetical protein GCM10023082_15580 [Streptomyces tremellae]|uniref:Uncharacterized protein n=1 Tax=Streptomyces tremellae TaxID=1124239 RepID=A0ABP7ELW5_9ACTN